MSYTNSRLGKKQVASMPSLPEKTKSHLALIYWTCWASRYVILLLVTAEPRWKQCTLTMLYWAAIFPIVMVRRRNRARPIFVTTLRVASQSMQIGLFHVWLQDLSGDYGFDRARENGWWYNTLVIARRDNVSSPCAIKLDA